VQGPILWNGQEDCQGSCGMAPLGYYWEQLFKGPIARGRMGTLRLNKQYFRRICFHFLR